jgi:polyphosphate kinase 2 (PPK2 family)
MASPSSDDRLTYPYFWRVHTRLPERFGQACRVLVRSKMNSCLVEFIDGFRVITSRNYIRKRKQKQS